MTTGGASPGNQVTVSCVRCGRRTTFADARPGAAVACPDCGNAMRVPSLAGVQSHVYRPTADTGEFGVASSPVAAPRAPEEKISVACRHCGARLKAGAQMRGQTVQCPRCKKKLTIPDATHPAATARSPAGQTAPADDGGEIRVAAAPPKPRVFNEPAAPAAAPGQSETDAAATRSEPTRRRRLKRPFTSGVFGFPFYAGCLPRWLALSAASIVVLAMPLLMLVLMSGDAGWLAAGMMIMGLSIMLAWIAISFFTVGFASACFLEIVQDTAAGNETVSEWPAPDWREWGAAFFAVAYWWSVALVPAGMAAHAFGIRDLPLLALDLVVGWATLPIVVLSGLESGSTLVPFSAPVFASLAECKGAWFRFYLVFGVVGALIVAASAVAQTAGGPLVLALLAPLFVWGWFVFARLLGRLGCVIADSVRRSNAAE